MLKAQRKKNFIFFILSSFLFFSLSFPLLARAEGEGEGKKRRKRSSDKLNVKQLEKKFWSSKDTKFKVVQNRAYPKKGRLSLGMQAGGWQGDSLSKGFSFVGDLAYYFSEQWGVSASFMNYSLEDSPFTESFNEDFSKLANTSGLKPNHNKVTGANTLSLLWIPFYAKMSLMGTSIVYFDMGVALGVGQTTYEQQVHEKHGGNVKKEAIHLSLDIFQYFFINRSFAFRFDVKTQRMSQGRTAFTYSASNADKRDLGEESFTYTSLMFGLSAFF